MQPSAPSFFHKWRCYTAPTRNFFRRKHVIMVAKAEVEEEVASSDNSSSDDFRALEEKVFRTIELLKSAREAQAAAERESRRLKEQFGGRSEETEGLRREVMALRREREDVRSRVEKMLKQIDALTGAESAR